MTFAKGACHLLFGRPQQHDKCTIHDSLPSFYEIKHQDQKFTLNALLMTLTPKQKIEAVSQKTLLVSEPTC